MANYHPITSGRVYNDNQSDQINDWCIVLEETSNVNVLDFMQNETHVLKIETKVMG